MIIFYGLFDMVIRSGFIVGIYTFLSRLLGFVRDMFITEFLGTTIQADCFNIAFRLPNFFRRIFAEGAFNSSFIPIYLKKIHDNDDAHGFANQTFTILTPILILLIVLLEITLPLMMYVLAPGYIKEQNFYAIELASNLSKITLPYLFFISISSLLGAMLNSIGRFASFAASPIFLNLNLIVFLLADFSNEKTYSLAWGVFCAGVVQLVIMIISAKNSGIRLKFEKFNKNAKDLKKLFKNMVPSIIGGSIMQINILIDQALASYLPTGAISMLIYADRINQLPLSLIGTAIGTVLLPLLSKQKNISSPEEILHTQNRAIEIALFLAIPSSIGIIFGAELFCQMIYERGAFNHQNTIDTANSLKIFALSLPGYIIVKVLTPHFFAKYDTKTPLIISIICLICNSLIGFILSKYFSFFGIAIATSSSAWINAILLYYFLQKDKLIKFDKKLKANIIYIIISAMFMSICLYTYTKSSTINSAFISSFLLIIVGSMSYLSSAYILKIFDLKEIIKISKR